MSERHELSLEDYRTLLHVREIMEERDRLRAEVARLKDGTRETPATPSAMKTCGACRGSGCVPLNFRERRILERLARGPATAIELHDGRGVLSGTHNALYSLESLGLVTRERGSGSFVWERVK